MNHRKILFLFLGLAMTMTSLSAQTVASLAEDRTVPSEQVAIDSLGFDSDYVQAVAVEEGDAVESNAIDPAAVIFGHIIDAHSWHMFDYYDKEGHEHAVAIPLPVIVINNGHVDCFWSSKFHHGHADYKGYRLVGGGAEKEEIVCVDENGELMIFPSPRYPQPSSSSAFCWW